MSIADSKPIDAQTRLCALLGFPVRHSGSPAMQNAGMKRLGLNWRYLALHVRPEDLASTLAGAKKMGVVGLNLTVPHKVAAFDLLDELDESARHWGAVNTVRFEGRSPQGDWRSLAHPEADEFTEIRAVGYNTDADAIIGSLEAELGLDLAGITALVTGIGGAGRVAALKLAQSGAKKLFLINRTAAKATDLQGVIRNRFPECETIVGYPEEPLDLLVNGTSLGLGSADPFPIDRERLDFSRVTAVYDLIYQPAETPLLREAKQAGCRSANGLGMLVRQGAEALTIWSGLEAPETVMRQALEKHVYGAE